MGKKRKVWWIVGAIVAAVALFAGFAFLSVYNSTEARIERAVAQIVEEYGFEFQFQSPDWSDYNEISPVSITEYQRAPMSVETAGEIVDFIRGACPSLDYRYTALDKDGVHVTISGGDPWVDVYSFHAREPDGSLTDGISFCPDSKGLQGLGPDSAEPNAILELTTFDRPSLWQRIKALWPW